jgi:hypothetical protein
MKYTAHVRLKYPNKKLDKSYRILRVLDETHAKQVLTYNLRIKHPKMRNFELISLNKAI